jgi:alpha-galactosidase
MNVRPDADRRPLVSAGAFELGPVLPLLNSEPLAGWEVAERTSEEDHHWRFTAPALGAGSFDLLWTATDEGPATLQYWLEGAPADLVVDSFGIRFEGVSGARAVLRQGYQSWDGSDYITPAQLAGGADATGYALTQLLPATGAENLVLGFERHERFQQTFRWSGDTSRLALDITTFWDRREAGDTARLAGETLLLLLQPGVEDGLRRWAHVVAAANPEPPRLPPAPISGWCSWYNHYAAIDEVTIRTELQGAATVRDESGLPLQVFQIDDGFTPEMGDWLDVKPEFPRGMAPLLAVIRAAGFRPGLWIAPFVVGNRSRLYREHPDWVVQDRASGGPLLQMRFYGESRWHKRSEEYYILDATHPDAFAYLRHVFGTWRREWGCEYFKTDFMFFGSEQGPDRAVYHTPGLTRIDIWRRVAVMIREEIGDALWLGCGCPLWAAVGLVDAVRIGRDMGVSWDGERAARSILGDLQRRNFANGILWQLDPDCLLLRSRFHHLSNGEQRALALYAGLAGGVLITSDTLDEIPPGHLELFHFLLDLPPGTCRFPLLGEETGEVLVQVRSMGNETLLFVLNAGQELTRRGFDLAALGIATPVCVRIWPGVERSEQRGAKVELELPPHHGQLLLLAPEPPD